MNLHFIKGLALWYMHRPRRIKMYIDRNRRNQERICKKDSVVVVFFASNISMWRYQGLYEEMLKFPRFKAYIVLSPLNAYSKEQKKESVECLRSYFKSKGIKYIDYDINKMRGYDIKKFLKPDILFYPQPYYTVMCKEHRYYKFNDSLLAYYPYGVSLRREKFCYDEDFHNRAWRRYYENEFTREDARLMSTVGDSNVVIVGSITADEFLKPRKDVWKIQSIKKRRLIWAPHFTINENGWSQNTCFLWMADFMLSLAEKYKEQIQIAFKPHPRLLSELYLHPDWGHERADAYYKKWEQMSNTQLELGNYIDLFMTSNAMIHDSGSFAAEYMYSGNPVLYVSKDMSHLYEVANGLGNLVYRAHYVADNILSIEQFVVDTLIKGVDPLKEKRKGITQYLVPRNGKTVAENTMDDLLHVL